MIDISEIADGYNRGLYLDEVQDLGIPVTDLTRIRIAINNVTVLDNQYYPSFDGFIHLDIRDLVRSSTVIYIPTSGEHENEEDEMVHNRLLHQVFGSAQTTITATTAAGNEAHWTVTIYAFERGVLQRMTDIDEMLIPKDYLLPLSLHFNTDEVYRAYIAAELISGHRKEVLFEPRQIDFSNGDDGDSWPYACLFSEDLSLDDLPVRPDEPFKIVFHVTGAYSSFTPIPFDRDIETPVFRIGSRPAEQYLFLNRYGNYDNVAMTGALYYEPEFEVENAHRAYSVERVKGFKRDAWRQHTGHLSKASLEALAELLLSPRIYRYVPGEGVRRIVIEEPSLTVNAKENINTASFVWRYAEK